MNQEEKRPSILESLLEISEKERAHVSLLMNQNRIYKESKLQPISENNRNSEIDIFRKNLEFRRWLVLLSYSLLNFLNGFAWGTYSPIIEESQVYYEASSFQVCWFIYQFYILYIVFAIPGSYMLGKSLSLSIKLGAFFNALGAWLRYAAFQNYSFALFGQCLIALSSNVIMPASNNIANAWFHAKERFLAVTFGVFSNAFGTGVGFLVSPLIVSHNPDNITFLNFVSAVILTVPLVLCLLTVKDKPKYPPNLATTMEKANFYLSFKLLIRNKKYILAAFSFGICFGNCWSILSIIDLFLAGEHITSYVVGILGLTLITAGMLVSIIATLFLRYASDSRRFFDPLTKFLFTVTMIALLIISILIPMESYLPILIIGLVLLGVGSLGLQPFECQALEEISFPVQESISVSGMFFVMSAFGFPLSIISTLDVFGNYGLWTLTIALFPFAIYILFIYKTDFKKSKQEGHYSSFNERIPSSYFEQENDDTSLEIGQEETRQN